MSWTRCRPKYETRRAFQYQTGVPVPEGVEVFTRVTQIPGTMEASNIREWLLKNLDQQAAVIRIRGRWFGMFPGEWVVETTPAILSSFTDEQFRAEYEVL
jgi:hypothetical protein